MNKALKEEVAAISRDLAPFSDELSNLIEDELEAMLRAPEVRKERMQDNINRLVCAVDAIEAAVRALNVVSA